MKNLDDFHDWYFSGTPITDFELKSANYRMCLNAFTGGRESMREDAINKLKDYDAGKCAQIVAGIEV